MKKRWIICDEWNDYAIRLADFIQKEDAGGRDIYIFTGFEELEEGIDQKEYEVLLIGEEIWTEKVKELPVKHIWCLTNHRETGDGFLYRYQRADILFHRICETLEVSLPVGDSKKAGVAEFWGIYSPVHRCLKTTFSLVLSHFLGSRCKTLYVNLEEYAVIGFFLGQKAEAEMRAEQGLSISDLYESYQQNLPVMQRDSICQHQTFDYLLPARCPEDLQQMEPERLWEAIGSLVAHKKYGAVVLDLGSQLSDFRMILQQCQFVFMPGREDSISQYKMEAFENYLCETGYENVHSRIRKIILPLPGGGDRGISLESLIWSEWGDQVRKLSGIG